MTTSPASARPAALVTGASRGIGAAVAVALAADGRDVLLAYGSRHEAAAAVAQRCIDLGVRASTVRADFADPAGAVATVFAAVDQRLGRLDVLVNNAGMLPPSGPIDHLRDDDAVRTLNVNTLAPLLCAREAVCRMRPQTGGRGGVIVNLTSGAAVRGSGGEFVHYGMSKAALDALTVGLAREVAADGIRVVGVRPGLIDTDMNAERPGRLERMLASVPLGRAGSADEVAEAVRWLASDAAAYITGTTLDVSGGR